MIKCKEDLIGQTRKCPYPNCDVEFTITKESHRHQNNKHIYCTTLDEQWIYYIWELEYNRRMLYGKE
jgi:hypothetical protein